MPLILRIPIALVLLAIAAFFLFGFLATFEPPGHLTWRIGYATATLICFAGIVWMVLPCTWRSDR